MLCGAEHFTDFEDFGKAKQDWLRTFLRLPGGIPSHDTFRRVFMLIDPGQFSECFHNWSESLRRALSQEVVALDGKTLRRSYDSFKNKKAIHVVSAWARENGLVLGQVKVDEKSNEITAIPELLRVLELSGCIVTIDALGTQKAIVTEICNADADYVLALKGNHEKVHEEVAGFLCDARARGFAGVKHDFLPERRERPRTHRDTPVLDQRGDRLVRGSREMGGAAQRRHGRAHPGDRRKEHPRGRLSSLQHPCRCAHLRPCGARPLGH